VDLFGQRGTARIDAEGADGQKGRGDDEKRCKLHGGDDVDEWIDDSRNTNELPPMADGNNEGQGPAEQQSKSAGS